MAAPTTQPAAPVVGAARPVTGKQRPGVDRHEALTVLVGRAVTSANQLSDLDAVRVIDTLTKEAET